MSNSQRIPNATDDEQSREASLIEATLNLCPQWFNVANIHTGFAADLLQFLVALRADLQQQSNTPPEIEPTAPELAAVEFALQSLPLWVEYLQPNDDTAERLRRHLHQRRSILRRYSANDRSPMDAP